MRKATATVLLAATGAGFAFGIASPASSSATKVHTTLTATPRSVVPGHVVTFRGKHWGTLEFCPKAQVTLMVKAGLGQLGIFVGQAKVRSGGSWTVRWHTPTEEQIGTSLTILAREYCESGQGASTIALERTVKIHFTGLPA